MGVGVRVCACGCVGVGAGVAWVCVGVACGCGCGVRRPRVWRVGVGACGARVCRYARVWACGVVRGVGVGVYFNSLLSFFFFSSKV